MSRNQGPAPDHDLKIVMVGSIGVGKTSLVCRFVKDTFRDFLTTTIGASYMFKTETLNEQLVKYSLWDTAGQEQFHSLVPLYFRDADGVVMVVDATRPGSVHEDVKIWIDKVRQAAPPNVTVVIATNKSDVPSGADEAHFNAEQMAGEFGFQTALVSAKTGNGVQEMFRSLAEACIAKKVGNQLRKQSGLVDLRKEESAGEESDESEDERAGRNKVGTARRTNSNAKKFTLKSKTGQRKPPAEKKCKC